MKPSRLIGSIAICGLVIVSGFFGAPAVSAPSAALSVELALANPQQLVQRPWRTELAGALRELPQWKQTHTAGKSLQGRIIAGKVRLPEKVEVTGSTTILADVIELTAGSVEIRANGHGVHLFPVTEIRRVMAAGVAPASVITIDTSSSNTGSSGFSGTPGNDGLDGTQGSNGYSDPNNCNTLNGGNGSAADDGTAGSKGGNGGQGGDAGGISLAIPDGSQDSYVLIARGASGGSGGPGGSGGSGGRGGDGGDGAYGYYECGGNGGSGGNGGKGGDGAGGDGGNGGSGGKGGDVNISYPPGYDRSKVTMDLRGGSGGGGGSAGFSGIPGTGGSGGFGGDGVYGRGNDGAQGPGGIQKIGSVGSSGSSGSDGRVTDTPIVTVGVSKPVYLIGESPVYTVTGAPNSPIFWTSTLNGAPTGEDHTFYGHYTDANGRATITGAAWTEDAAGSWMKQVTIGGLDGRAFFEVRMTGPWADWTALRGVLTERIGAVPTQNGVIAYGRGTDNGLYYNELNNSSWTGWRGLGGTLTSRPVPAGYYNVFARGHDGSVIHGFFHSSAGTQWESLGGYIIGTPAVTSYRCPAWENPLARCTMILVRGGDNALYVNQQRGPYDPSWTGWQHLGGTLTSDPTATFRIGRTVSVDVENQVQVFGRNAGGGISTRLFNGTFWEDWQDLGGSIQGSPESVASVSYYPGFMTNSFVFARGSDDSLMVNRMENGGWLGWQNLGGILRSDPVAVAPFLSNQGTVHVSVLGTDNGFHTRSWASTGAWEGWRSHAGSSSLAPGIVSRGSVPELFGVDKDNGRGYHRIVYVP